MIMNNLPKPTVIKMLPTEVLSIPTERDGFRLLAMQGVGCEYSLFYEMEQDGGEDRIILICLADSGPREGLQRMMRTPRDCHVWTVPAWRTVADTEERHAFQENVIRWTVEHVNREVRADAGI